MILSLSTIESGVLRKSNPNGVLLTILLPFFKYLYN
jgi:hypothetical protein